MWILPNYVFEDRQTYLPLSSDCSNRFKMFLDFDIQVDGLVTPDSKTWQFLLGPKNIKIIVSNCISRKLYEIRVCYTESMFNICNSYVVF